jgi:hypothetical protein
MSEFVPVQVFESIQSVSAKPRHMNKSAWLARMEYRVAESLGRGIVDHFGVGHQDYDVNTLDPENFQLKVVAMTPEYYKELKKKADAYDRLPHENN